MSTVQISRVTASKTTLNSSGENAESRVLFFEHENFRFPYCTFDHRFFFLFLSILVELYEFVECTKINAVDTVESFFQSVCFPRYPCVFLPKNGVKTIASVVRGHF